MMNKLLFLISALLLIACVKTDDTTFSVVCDTKTEWYANINGMKGEEKSTELLTFIFKNKKLEGYTCDIWTPEEIHCSKNFKIDAHTGNQVLNFDRLSGKFSSHKYENDPKNKTSESKHWNGKCEKVKENKF